MTSPHQAEYETRETRHATVAQRLKQRFDLLSVIRFLLFVGAFASLYVYFFRDGSRLWILLAMGIVGGFIWLMRYHYQVSRDRLFHQTLTTINANEISILSDQANPYPDGSAFKPTTHDYALDLDIIGEHSLYHFINRTGLWRSREKLAEQFLYTGPAQAIEEKQTAVRELSQLLDWRQELLAHTSMANDSHEKNAKLEDWLHEKVRKPTPVLQLLAIALTIGFVSSILAYVIFGFAAAELGMKWFFIGNLFLAASQFTAVQKMLNYSTALVEQLHQLSLIATHIEQANFSSPYLQQLQSKLQTNQQPHSKELNKIASLFRQLDSVQNPFGAIVVNGVCAYHLHIKYGIDKWRLGRSTAVADCLDVASEIEALASLANFSYNHPEYIFPTIGQEEKLSFQQVGHPLIAATHRVCNDISFDEKPFVILTGSNMSGKSTFLRTLGVNIVLGKMGAPVCAKAATVFPYQLLVSMRLADSLADDESYFFAEVKRLKYVADAIERAPSFILLDEILRGTNSDDKRTGTIAYIEKLADRTTMGCIATHDLEVCETSNKYPDFMTNKCFEVEVVNNELQFDYLLRDGVCQSKSATFLMNKMGIIDRDD